jgi:hypothetical protein
MPLETLELDAVQQPSLNNDALSRTVWMEEMAELLLSAMSSQWRIGDLARRTPAEASREEVKELLEEAAARTGYDVNTIRDMRTVSERITPELRKPNLSWYGHKEISKLSVSANGKVSEVESIALRSEFLERFAAAGVMEIRSAVREKMNKRVASGDTETVSFRLTSTEYSRLESIVQVHPIHDSVEGLVQALVREFIQSNSGGHQ